MKTNVINQYSPQNTRQYQADRHVKYTSNNQSKIYLQDKINISDKLKHTVRTGDNQQVEFIYSLSSKEITAHVIIQDVIKIKVKSEDLPKELKQISNPKGFKAFLSNIHVKVNTLSNGDYKLYVNQNGLGGMMGRRYYTSGSITPSTQGNENFERLELQQEQLHEQLLLYAKEKDYSQIQNISSTLVEQQHITNPDNVIFELDYQENINPNAVQEQEEMKQEESQSQVPSTQGPLVKRFGINPQAVGSAAGYNITYDRLHYVEREVFRFAIQELSEKPSAQELQGQQILEEYPHNVVVVDIFSREQGIIKATQAGFPETHTVVLWKKEHNTIVLIDPSHVKFSQHISTQQIQVLVTLTDFSIIPIKPRGDIVYGTQGKPTGYSKYDHLIPQPRDCIDIAVKIALEINEHQQAGIKSEQIEENVFSQISNKKALSKAVRSIDNAFIRELQSSSKDTRIGAKQFLEDEQVQLITPKVINKNLISVKQSYEAYTNLEQSTEGDYYFLKENTKGINIGSKKK